MGEEKRLERAVRAQGGDRGSVEGWTGRARAARERVLRALLFAVLGGLLGGAP